MAEETDGAGKSEPASPQTKLTQQELATAMRHNPRVRPASHVLKNFNTWLIGGNYSHKKLLQARPPPLPRSESSERIKHKIGEMRANLMRQSRQGKQAGRTAHRYVNMHLRRGDRSTADPGPGADSAPPSARDAGDKDPEKVKPASRPNTAPRPTAQRGQQQQEPDQRRQLKTSLVDHASQSAYVSMFPPLFTPYDRAAGSRMMRGWGSGVQRYYRDIGESPRPAQSVVMASASWGGAAQSEEPATVGDSQLGVVRSPVKRPRGLAGQPGFYPTGTTVNAYRHYTNYRLALESDQNSAEASGRRLASGSGQPLYKLLRSHRSAAAAAGGNAGGGLQGSPHGSPQEQPEASGSAPQPDGSAVRPPTAPAPAQPQQPNGEDIQEYVARLEAAEGDRAPPPIDPAADRTPPAHALPPPGDGAVTPASGPNDEQGSLHASANVAQEEQPEPASKDGGGPD
eukprot:TRINITY_DN25360_c0_g1_i1.p1 TRINITY_DN25360_c0_g1~~TRINITY_DN25360_c0_g1_i1.p1  ORF type:complete len:472 (+),score=74.53 TRINITY_DN25360_c0_g1_i1:51-1418(+)